MGHFDGIASDRRIDWFPKFAASCTWYDDDGTQEDVLSQAGKVSGILRGTTVG